MIRKIAFACAATVSVYALAETVTLHDLLPYGNDAKMEDAPGYWATTGRIDTVVSQSASGIAGFDSRIATVSTGTDIDGFDSRQRTVAEGSLTHVIISGFGGMIIIR